MKNQGLNGATQLSSIAGASEFLEQWEDLGPKLSFAPTKEDKQSEKWLDFHPKE